jgi:DNA-binding NtrC family response regulator
MVTREQIESVLGRVRPFLQADGGDITLIDVHGDSADVRLSGISASILFRAAAQPSMTVTPSASPQQPRPISLDDRLREVEANLIGWALKLSGGNKSRAAELLQIKRSTLGDRINRCGLGKPASGEATSQGLSPETNRVRDESRALPALRQDAVC